MHLLPSFSHSLLSFTYSLVYILPHIFGDWHYNRCHHQPVHYTHYKELDDQDHSDNSVSPQSVNQQLNNNYVIEKL